MSRAPAIIAVTVASLGAAWMLMPAPSTDLPAKPEAVAKVAKEKNRAVASTSSARPRPGTLAPATKPKAEPMKTAEVLSRAPVTEGNADEIMQDRIDRTLVSSRTALKIWGTAAKSKEENVAVSEAMAFVEDQLEGLQRQFDASRGSSKALTAQLDRIVIDATKDLEEVLGEPPADVKKLLKPYNEPAETPGEEQPPLEWGKPLDW